MGNSSFRGGRLRRRRLHDLPHPLVMPSASIREGVTVQVEFHRDPNSIFHQRAHKDRMSGGDLLEEPAGINHLSAIETVEDSDRELHIHDWHRLDPQIRAMDSEKIENGLNMLIGCQVWIAV